MDEFLTPEEAAALLKVHSQTIYRKLRSGQLPGARIGGQWRLRRADIDKLFEPAAKRPRTKTKTAR